MLGPLAFTARHPWPAFLLGLSRPVLVIALILLMVFFFSSLFIVQRIEPAG